MLARLTRLFFNIHQIAYFVKPLSSQHPSIFFYLCRPFWRHESMRYQIHIFTTPETDSKLGRLLTFHAKEVIKQVLCMDWKELNSIPAEDVKAFYSQDRKQKCIYVDKETYEKWKQLPRSLKQPAIYLINKKLMEVEL